MISTPAIHRLSLVKHHKTVLLDCHGSPLFEWCGPACTVSDAERLAGDAYALSLAAIYKAHGLSYYDVDADLKAPDVVSAELAAPATWRVTWRAAYEASKHAKARTNSVPQGIVVPLLHDAIHSDKRCLLAMAAGTELEIGIWMDSVGNRGLVDVGSSIFATRQGATSRFKLGDATLQDAVRVLALRCIAPYHGSKGPRRGQPYQGLKFPIEPRPASVRHASLTSGVFPARSLIDWLAQDGFGELAGRLGQPQQKQ